MINAVLIDDEINSIKALSLLLEKNCPEVAIVAKCTDAQEGIRAIRELRQDENNLVLLDIKMPFMSGFELLEQLDEIHFELIFITAYDQHALEAFKVNAVDYLLKPVTASDLRTSIRRVTDRLEKQLSMQKLSRLLESIRTGPGDRASFKLALPSLESIHYFFPHEIIRCEAQNNYCLFVFRNSSRMLVSRNLGEYESLLAPHNFFRVHKSHLVNLAYVRKYVRGEGGQLIMEDGAAVDVSRAKKEEVLRRLAGI
jgi:two-component system LytT family response regulator